MAAVSLENGSAERPWNERVQSILSSCADSNSSGLSSSPLFEMLSVVGRLGVGDAREPEEVVLLGADRGVDVVLLLGTDVVELVPPLAGVSAARMLLELIARDAKG